MASQIKRRNFLGRACAFAGALLSWEERALLARPKTAPEKGSLRPFPHGSIGRLQVSRLICGGNLISGFAHSRDLIYVSPLLRRYFTDEKVFETLSLCEEEGIDTAILRVDSHIERIITRYWNERGGRIQWIAQAKPKDDDLFYDVDKAVSLGAQAVYLQGGVADRWVRKGRLDLVAKVLDHIRRKNVPAGIGAHALETVVACERAGLDPDF